MKQISVTEARKRLKQVLSDPGLEGTAIERHGKPIAFLIPANQPWAPKDQSEQREARLHQAAVETQRLVKHLRIGNRLLAASPPEAQAMIRSALSRVAQWEKEDLCSRDYIDRWRALLSRPRVELVEAMCGDPDGWGPALRQNSPWPRLER